MYLLQRKGVRRDKDMWVGSVGSKVWWKERTEVWEEEGERRGKWTAGMLEC
jgi:hypothetical protein